jgi:hypothetical protein
VKYIWQLVAESLVLSPWTEAEIAEAKAKAEAQWQAFGIDPDETL